MLSKFSSRPKILSITVPEKGVGWIMVDGFILSWVKSWFINCTVSISIRSLGSEVSKDLSLESVRELSNNCGSLSQSKTQSWAESVRESVGDSGWQLTIVSNGVRRGNWMTVSPSSVTFYFSNMDKEVIKEGERIIKVRKGQKRNARRRQRQAFVQYANICITKYDYEHRG